MTEATNQRDTALHFSKLYFADDAYDNRGSLTRGDDGKIRYVDDDRYNYGTSSSSSNSMLPMQPQKQKPKPPKSILKTSTGSSKDLTVRKPVQQMPATVRYADSVSTDAASGIITTSADRRYTTKGSIPGSPQSSVMTASTSLFSQDDPDYLAPAKTPLDLLKIFDADRNEVRHRTVPRSHTQPQPQPQLQEQQQQQQQQPQRRNISGGYNGYYGSPRQPRPPPTQTSSHPKNTQPFSGFYIDQEKKIEESKKQNFLMSAYTAKTHRDVFQEDEHHISPIEDVFDEKGDNKDDKLTLRNVFKKNTSSKEYDYYEERDRLNREQEKLEAGDESNKQDDTEGSQEQELRKQNRIRNVMNRFKIKKKVYTPVLNPDGTVVEEHGYVLVEKPNGKREFVKRKKIFPEEFTEELPMEAGDETLSEGESLAGNSESSGSVDDNAAVASVAAEGLGIAPVLGYLGSWVSYAVSSIPTIASAAMTGAGYGSETQQPDELPEAPEPIDVVEVEEKKPVGWKKIKDMGATTKTRWQALQQPANHLFNGGFSAAEAAAIKRAQEKQRQKNMEILRQKAHYDKNTNEIYIDYEEGEVVMETIYRDEDTEQIKGGDPLVEDFSSLQSTTSSPASSNEPASPVQIISNIAEAIKSIKIMRILFAPIDVIAEAFPNLQTIVILIELIIFVWILYELSLLVDALCMMVKAICAPMIAIGKFMNRVI